MTVLEMELEAENQKLKAALQKIYDTNWMWEGGGSQTRILCTYGKIAADALGLPHDLSKGWPK